MLQQGSFNFYRIFPPLVHDGLKIVGFLKLVSNKYMNNHGEGLLPRELPCLVERPGLSEQPVLILLRKVNYENKYCHFCKFLSISVCFCSFLHFLSVSECFCTRLSVSVRFCPFLPFPVSFCLFLSISAYYCPFGDFLVSLPQQFQPTATVATSW